MFFVISKTVGYMLLPSNFLIGLGLFGAILLLTRFDRLGRRLMATALALLAICAFSPLANFLLYPLEQRFPKWDSSRGDPDGIIVLGGPLDADLSAAHGVPVIAGAADRIFSAATLALRYPNARLVYTGDIAVTCDGTAAPFVRTGGRVEVACTGAALSMRPAP